MENWFEELSTMRKRFDDSVLENKFAKGIYQSTVEKYPDPVHFIYELLQNAEDQEATEAQFVLSAHGLVFRHNGKSFTRSDVINITSIGNSDKIRESNKIGRFGIGFKSVFAITDRPEIYTQLEKKRFAFAIENLVVPVALSENDEQNHHYNTQFIFPFIKGQGKTLYPKIKERLSMLGFEALLFLQNLVAIEWQAGAEYHGRYAHTVKDVSGGRHELRGDSVEKGQRRQSTVEYLMFTRKVRLKDENERRLDVRIAFKLDEKGSIIAEPDQKLAVYFPTEQATGLNFRLHGPFLLTDNRANIKSDDDTNKKLLQECAILLDEGIQHIKEKGLLTVDFLSQLPIRKENVLTAQFTLLYDQVLKTLKQHPLLPTATGTFIRATEAKLARGGDLRELLNDQQLSLLYGASTPFYWLSPEITVDRVPDLYQYLTKSLEVDVVDPATFVRRLETPFLEKQTDEWLVKLYIFLSKLQGFGLTTIIKGKPILRLEDTSHVSPFKKAPSYTGGEAPNAYLPPKGESKFTLVKRSLTGDKAAYAFLKGIGLSEPDIVDEVIKFVLPPYDRGDVAIDNEAGSKKDLFDIQEALKRKEHPGRSHLLSQLNKTPFIRAINAKTSEKAWKTPREVYSRTDELLIWFDGNEQAWFIANAFSEALLSDLSIPTYLRPKANKAARNIGYVVIHDSKGFHKRGLHGFDPDAKLDGLDYVLEHITLERAKLLWNFLLEHRHLIKGVVETSTYQTFIEAQREEQFSEIGQLCSKNVWLPDKEGEFYAPNGMFLTDLAEEFETSTLEAQEVAQRLGMRKAEELQLANKLGIPPEFIVFIQNDPDAFRTWCYKQQQKPSLPSSVTNEPERRKEKAAVAAASYASEEKTYKAVTINRHSIADNNEPKPYLRNHNTNEEGQLICQLCDQPMPFSLPNGEEYFVACQYIDLFEKEYPANHLALCPNCAAEFMYACQTDENKREELILAMNAATSEENLIVQIDMPVHQHLRFTQRHLIDLQAATEEEKRRRMGELLSSS
jgi:hypothetical protein